ncbi:TonB-dependent receptor [Caviibacterium pharyngocola]|uniref:TonB-dependent receptor n=1 Tax=Caviibacterium pharyngocola TaxID=28159 RepID=A0A2M8RW31_9PAST|nr:TonB-dependent receptor [Caviibacterium pharyngocola]PJG83101.1 TonB-dependent receptor [Caviibacterium pharyngocola]
MNKKNMLALLLFGGMGINVVNGQEVVLDEISVESKMDKISGSAVENSINLSDQIVSREKLSLASATLGNALSREIGVHSNPFGGGASSPIIRGQEGVRVKILQNGSDVIDMSTISPDHAVAADTLLAQRVELIRGPQTLLYATASQAGIINVADKRILAEMPKKGVEGEIYSRLDSVSKEKSLTVGFSFALNKNIALRLEGLQRHSDNYRVPGINLGETLKFVPDTHQRSKVGTVGLSFINDRGYIGVSYNHRQDRYGLPGHNHMLDNCSAHIYDVQKHSVLRRDYLLPYPHLMDDSDLISTIHFHCGTEVDSAKPHSHDNVYGHQHDHSSPGPWVDLISKRVDLKGEIKNPLKAIERMKFSLAYADYYHDEKGDGKAYISPNDNESLKARKQKDAQALFGKPLARFTNRGFNGRVEFYHQPLGSLTGGWGMQYQFQKTKVARLAPPMGLDDVPTTIGEREISERNPLVANTTKQWSLFGLEQWIYKDFMFEVAGRFEKQRIPINYDATLLKIYHKPGSEQPDLSTNKQAAFSSSVTGLWNFTSEDSIALNLSHNERLPTAKELYYYGKHLATNSFEYGNKNLNKERSNNIEITLAHSGEKLDYKLSVYQNRFKNYIHNENLYRSGNLYVRRYLQSQAKFQGIEGEINYHITPEHQVSLFGDYVRGRLFKLPTILGDKIYEKKCFINEWDEEECDYTVVGREQIQRPNRNAARVPPARLGIRLNSQFNENWSGFIEYTRVFKQSKISESIFTKEKEDDREDKVEGAKLDKIPVYEDATQGYHLVNLGATYHNQYNGVDYRISLHINNLLNQKIYIHNSFLPYVPQPGRNFILGLDMKF